MKLNDQHVSDVTLSGLIEFTEIEYKLRYSIIRKNVLNALLELKQRRAEDRQRESRDANENA